MTEPTKEAIYDAEISPLMTQIIAICKRANIPFHAGFALDGDLECTTHVPPDESRLGEDDAEAVDSWCERYDPVLPAPSLPALTINVRDKHGRIISSEVVL